MFFFFIYLGGDVLGKGSLILVVFMPVLLNINFSNKPDIKSYVRK